MVWVKGKTYKVIQYATGGIGVEALPAILDHPQLELTGLLVHSADKVGRDAGELVGRAPVGVAATQDLDALLDSDADCVAHFALFPDIDVICRILEAGKNVVTTAGLLYPHYYGGELVERLEAACAKGKSSVHGTGINPGFSGEVLPLTISCLNRRIESIEIDEFADFTTYNSPELNHDMLGFGKTPAELAKLNHPYEAVMREFFHQSIAMVADGLQAPLDGIEEKTEYAYAKHDFNIESGPIKAGTMAALKRRFMGMIKGEPRINIQLTWICGYDLGEGWPRLEDNNNDSEWRVTLEGDPSFRVRFEYAPSFANPVTDVRHVKPSMIATAMHAVHAIGPVCDASPGIKTFLNLPMIMGAHTLR